MSYFSATHHSVSGIPKNDVPFVIFSRTGFDNPAAPVLDQAKPPPGNGLIEQLLPR